MHLAFVKNEERWKKIENKKEKKKEKPTGSGNERTVKKHKKRWKVEGRVGDNMQSSKEKKRKSRKCF